MRRAARRMPRGVTLVETALSLGVLAMALPLVVVAMARGGAVVARADLEAVAPRVAERARAEALRAWRLEGARSPIVYRFREGGEWLGVVDEGGEDAGREPVGLATVTAVAGGGEEMLVVVEFPADRNPDDRMRLHFQTGIP